MFKVEEASEESPGWYELVDDARGIDLIVRCNSRYDQKELATALADALNAVPIAIERLPPPEPPVPLSPGRLLETLTE